MDPEHRIQTGLIKALGDAVANGSPPADIGEILDQLTDYSEAHFMSEELLMRLDSYDGYEEHVAEHARLMDELDELNTRLDAGDLGALEEQARALQSELLAHIGSFDRRYVSWTPC
jgi:hemerythrin